MKRCTLVICFFFTGIAAIFPQQSRWKKGIVLEEYIYEKAPFPECHAATIAETPKGLVASWFGGTKERNPDVEIWVSRKEGKEWTKPVSVADGIQNDTLRYPCWNPVLYQVPSGELILFYKIGPKPSDWKGWMKTSKDAGITWSAARPLPNGFVGPVKNRPELLGNGKLLSPSSKEGDGWKVHFESSPDFGKTWKMIGPIAGNGLNAIQPSILFHKDGRLQIIARSQNRALLTSYSNDMGETWSPLSKTSLPNNNSGTDAVTLKDGRQLLVYNHVLPPGTDIKGARTPLNIAISADGVNWSAALVLEDSPISQYSYPSVMQSADGMVHIVYTWRREKIRYVMVDPSKLALTKIVDGKWPK